MIKKFLNISFIKNFYLKIFWSLNQKNFCIIYNLISKIFYNNRTQIKYVDDIFFLIENNKVVWHFKYTTRGFHYLNGLKNKAQLIHKEYLVDNLKFKDFEIIIDVGANTGDFFLNFDKKINYYGIEPSPEVFFVLKKNISDHILINKAAYTFSDKKLEFYLDDEDANSSLILIQNVKKIIKVQTISLDDLIKKINSKIKLIKIDTEGAEPETLYGLNTQLNQVQYISIDCGYERGIQKESTFVDCKKYLLDKNFELIKFSTDRFVHLFKNKNFFIK